MLSSIIQFLKLHRSVATQAVGQHAEFATANTPPDSNQVAGAEEEMDILKGDPVFPDAIWEHAGAVSTD